VKIYGAGLAGLIAGCVFTKAKIFEKNEMPMASHQALLRFRSNRVSELTGVKFKKVNVLKSIWSENREFFPTPRLVALYSKKVTGKYENRSIMNIDPCVRYIAPDNFHEILYSDMKDRVTSGYEITNKDYGPSETTISTLPLSINAKMLGYDFKTVKNFSCIYVNKFKIENCDMYATIYFPDESTSVYRASITGDMLIVESKNKITSIETLDVVNSFGLIDSDITRFLQNYKQPYGKLTSINDDERRVMIYKMSHDHNMFSLGRFALHKNILLDDVAKDIFVIKSMINDDSYGISIKDRL